MNWSHPLSDTRSLLFHQRYSPGLNYWVCCVNSYGLYLPWAIRWEVWSLYSLPPRGSWEYIAVSDASVESHDRELASPCLGASGGGCHLRCTPHRVLRFTALDWADARKLAMHPGRQGLAELNTFGIRATLRPGRAHRSLVVGETIPVPAMGIRRPPA